MLLELRSTRLLTDPVLRGRVAHLRRLGAPATVPDEVDAVLVSHAHHDHLDPASLRLIGKSTPIFLPRGAAGPLRRRGFRALHELDAGDEIEIGGVSVRATYAEHRPGRGPFSSRSPALGYLIGRRPGDPGEHWRAYFAGDTDLFPEMAGLADQLDIALLPVSGWGRRVPAGHLDPHRAAEAVRRLGPGLAIPIHWGTFAEAWASRRGADRGPALEFEREVARLGIKTRVEVLEPGASSAF